MTDIALYLARRDAYASFLSAADAESQVAHRRVDGRFADQTEALAAADRAYEVTGAAFNVIEIEGAGPISEARSLLAGLAALHREDEKPDLTQFKAAREEFVRRASEGLKDLLR
jgi:hypothetical protein